MQIITGITKEDLVIERDALVMGSVEGDIKVLSGANLHLNAKLKGNVHLSKYSKITIRNEVVGNIYDKGASIEIVNGEVQGEIIEQR